MNQIRLASIFALSLLVLAVGPVAESAGTPVNFCLGGEGAGQCDWPLGVAVDQSSGEPTGGDVYVADRNNARVDVFDSGGHFLRAFGYGVRDGANALETCTTSCIRGLFSDLPTAVAVDSSVGFSAHDLYSYNSALSRVEKYGLNPVSEEYELLLSFGSSGSGPGQFTGVNGGTKPLAVDSSGHVWVGDTERIEEFSEAGALLSEVALTGDGTVLSLALDGSGDFYVHNVLKPGGGAEGEPVPGVQKLKSNGEQIETLDASGHPNAIAVDPVTGDVFISDQLEPELGENYGRASLLEFGPTGAELEVFGSGEVLGGPYGNALVFGDGAQRLYVVSDGPKENSGAQAFLVPPPGPLPVSGTTKAKEIGKETVTLCANVNPEGLETRVHFQYIGEQQFRRNEEEAREGFAGAQETTVSASIGEDFSSHEACQTVSSLTPATAYRLRVVAANSDAAGGIDGETVGFATLPTAAIDSTSVSNVTAEGATLEAQIDPLGDATSYHFEYLTEAAYRENVEEALPPFSGATQAPSVDAPLGAGFSDVLAAQRVEGLLAHVAYRFRVVVRNAVSEANGGPLAGPTSAFTTQALSVPALADGRVWEQVSPPEKRGAALIPLRRERLIQAAASGDAIAAAATAPVEAQPPGNSGAFGLEVLSARGDAGWSSHEIDARHVTPTSASIGFGGEYRAFSADLTLGVIQPFGAFEAALYPGASERTPLLRSEFPAGAPTSFCGEGCYRPLVTGCPQAGESCAPSVEGLADVPTGTSFATRASCLTDFQATCGPQFVGATPDLAHVVLSSLVGLTAPGAGRGLYEFSAALPHGEALRLLSVLPDGEAVKSSAQPALGSGGLSPEVRNAISADGSRVVFEVEKHLYLRYNAMQPQSEVVAGQCSEPAKACTVLLDALQGGPGSTQAPSPRFKLASSDGSRVFFTDSQQLTPGSGAESHRGGDLYEYELEKPAGERLSDLTPVVGGEPAGVQGAVIGASQDGSSLYFVADGVQAHNKVENGDGEEQATPGSCVHGESSPAPSESCNLYLRHGGTTSFIASLSAVDQPSWGGKDGIPPELTARVSSDGRWLAFMSQRPLTGYDNRDVLSDQPDEEVFLYHAAASGGEGGLVCASCNPTGARPRGVEFGTSGESALVAGADIWRPNQWLAATLPTWTEYERSHAIRQPRYLSDSGRLFFNSSDALVSHDTNGTEDVYQYEPPGSAEEAPPHDTCTVGSPEYSSASGGCVDLVSSGVSPEESAFLDASETGDDVFFLTNAQLSRGDFDTSLDVYDARVGGGFPEPLAPPACEGDACQSPGSPTMDSTPASLTFSGPENIVAASIVVRKTRSLTRAQKLERALRACRGKPRKKRAVCERRAVKAYGTRSRKSERKGGR